MRLQDLFEFKYTINNLTYSMIKPKNNLTKLIIEGYLSFLKMKNLNESRFPKGNYKGKSKYFEYKVTFMKQHLDKIIKTVDSFVDEIPDLVEEGITVYSNTIDFTNDFNKLLNFVGDELDGFNYNLSSYIKNKRLSPYRIKKFKKINQQIKKFNSLLNYMEKVFKFDTIGIKGKELNIVFDEKEKEIYNLLMNTLEQRLPLLDIPKKPIEENRKYDIDVELI